jgi:hypothetical protein
LIRSGEPIDASNSNTRFFLVVKCTYSNLEELIKVGTEDGNEFQTFEKRNGAFVSEGQDTSIELQPTKFSVDKM